MKKVIIILFLAIISINSYGEGLYEASPFAYTKDSVSSFFTKKRLTVANKYLYVIYFAPSDCPRCEGLITPFVNFLINGKHCTMDDIVMIVDYANADVAKKYITDNNFNVKNVIIDNSERFFNYFYNNTNHLQVPYFYKFNEDFDLLRFNAFLGIELSQKLAKEIAEDSTIVPVTDLVLSDVKQEEDSSVINDQAYDALSFVKDIVLEQSEEAMPSKASSIYYDIETKRIAWLDYVLSAVYVYDENGKFVKQMEPSDSEFEKFSKIDIDTATYSMLKQNLLKVIYLKILNLNDKTVQLIGSLPRLYMTVEGSDTSVDYSNEMCIIDKGIDSASTIVSTIKFPEELNKKGFFPKHVNIYTYDSMILLPVYKGWPVIGSKGFDSTNYSASYNPFVDSFYDYTPLFYAIDTRNDSIKIVGNLSQQFKDDKSGYYNYRPKFIAKDNRLYFHDGYSGYFLVYDKKFKIIDTLFCLPAKKGIVRNTYNSNNTEQTPLEYLNATRMDIDTKIVDLKVVGNRLLLLYQYRDVMLLNNYNLTDRTSSIYKIDDKTNSTNKQNKYAISCTQDKALVTKVYDGIAKISFTKYIQL